MLNKLKDLLLNAKNWVSEQSLAVKLVLVSALALSLLLGAKVCLGASTLSLL